MPRPANGTTDDIARAAARLIAVGDVSDIDRAIRVAAETPGQGMALQAFGDAGYEEAVRDVWRVTEGLMTVIEADVVGATCLLAGRAARGQIDAGVTAHLRVYTDAAIRDIVEVLVGYGYEEPAFETANTRFGRLDRVRFDEKDVEIVITRCPADLYHRGERDRDLFKGKPVEIATLAEVRERLESA